jgi:hypothetical protein
MTVPCPSDDELLAAATEPLRMGEFSRHVESCPACQRRLAQLGAEVSALRSLTRDWSPSPPTPPIQLTVASTRPATIGRYVVLGELGSGGQADVYRVIDPELGRNLVLKLSRQYAREGDGRRDALFAEGRLLAELDHPGLLRVFDVGVYDGRPYLVLEHVSGRNLEQYFTERKPTPRQAARLIASLARVVAYAHRHGVIHGDIKPLNVLIDADGRARLIDFGLARLEGVWGEEASGSGGTPEFLPPELAADDEHRSRAREAADVFGLGATLYWLLTGRSPFAGASVLESLDRSRRCDIDLRLLRRIPRRLAKVCQRALAPDPRDRPNADQLAAQLERVAFPWRRRSVAAAATVLILCVGAFWWQHREVTTEKVAQQPVVQSAPEITVIRNDRVFDLSNVLPLRAGDRVAVACDISPGEPVVILWLDAAGQLQRLRPERTAVERVDRLTYPATNEWMPLSTPDGTEMVFFCRGQPPRDDGVNDCFIVDQALLQLPSVNYLTLRRGRVSTSGPLIPGSPEAKSVADAKLAMEQINRRLSRYFEGVSGVAFSHRDSDGEENDHD